MISSISLLFSATLIFSSPNNQDQKIKNPSNNILSISTYVSDWEKNQTFQHTTLEKENLYSLKRKVPQINNDVLENGAILVFTKGYGFIMESKQEKPMQMPFYLFSPIEDIQLPCNWMVTKSVGELEVGLRMPMQIVDRFQKEQSNIQFRYFVLDASFLKKHKLSRNTLNSMNYQQVVQLLNVAP